jgi:predicted amidohydrolase
MSAGGYPGFRPTIPTFGDEGFFKSESTWTSKQLFRMSETIPGPATQKLCQKAKERGIFVATGFAEADPTITGTIYNSSILISSHGDIVGRHRKLHVNGAELAYWKKGDIADVKVFPTALGRIGLAICYDLMFPEYTRLLDLMDEQIQCQLWATSAGYEIASDYFPITRALEGGIFVISSCIVGKDEVTGLAYAGGSQIVDPFGRVLAKAKTVSEELIVADINLDLILDYRASGVFTLGMDRREDVYDLSLVEKSKKPVHQS